MRVSQVVGWSVQNLYLCAVILTVDRYFEIKFAKQIHILLEIDYNHFHHAHTFHLVFLF